MASASNRASRRISTLTTAPKAPTSIDPTAIIADRAILTGNYPITVGPKVVIHPHARLISTNGPIRIGEGAIIWEKATIGIGANSDGALTGSTGDEEDDEDGVTIMRNVVVESAAVVEGREIGEGTTIEAFAIIEKGAVVGKYCKINSFITVAKAAQLPDYTVLFGDGQSRIDITSRDNPLVGEIKTATHHKHLKTLKGLIPSNLAKYTAE